MSSGKPDSLSDNKEFNYWWNVAGEEVEPRNFRRNGESGVERVKSPESGTLYVKRQTNHVYRSLFAPFGEPTINREVRAISALQKIGLKVPEIVFTASQLDKQGWKAILVTRELTGYTDLRHWYKSGGRERLGKQQHENFLRHLGQTLSRMHLHRWQHTSLNAHHIFVTAGTPDKLPEIALIDLEKARRRFSARQAAKRDMRQLRRRGKMWSDTEWSIIANGHKQSGL